MGRRGVESFAKRQKELKRKQKAQEKMARRYGRSKRKRDANADDPAQEKGPGEEEISPGDAASLSREDAKATDPGPNSTGI